MHVAIRARRHRHVCSRLNMASKHLAKLLAALSEDVRLPENDK